MQNKSKLLFGLQIGVLMTAVAFPVQAAINIGAPRALSGSVVTLRSYVPVTTQVTSIPTSAQANQTTISTPTTTYIQNPTPSQSRSVNVGPTPTTPSMSTTLPVIPSVSILTADEQNMVDMINQERRAVGVNPVKVDLRLGSVGRAKADDMKANNYFDHTSPTYGSPWAMMQQVELTVGWAGENISGNKSVAGSMAALMLSPGHRANILDPRFTHVGVGIAYGSAYGNLYVQEFLQE